MINQIAAGFRELEVRRCCKNCSAFGRNLSGGGKCKILMETVLNWSERDRMVCDMHGYIADAAREAAKRLEGGGDE